MSQLLLFINNSHIMHGHMDTFITGAVGKLENLFSKQLKR